MERGSRREGNKRSWVAGNKQVIAREFWGHKDSREVT